MKIRLIPRVLTIIVLSVFLHSILFADVLTGLRIEVNNESSKTMDYFPIGVWLQDPTKTHNGTTYAELYQDIGVNTFYGLWAWPSEEGMYSGYAVETVKTLKNLGMKVYAGEDLDAVEWVEDHPEYDDTILGYFVGDEPDMRKNDTGLEYLKPDPWNDKALEMQNADPGRDIYANFGKGFALENWIGYQPEVSMDADFEKYVEHLDMYSVDFYPFTDPYESDSYRGAYKYGLVVENAARWAEDRPVLGFIAGSAPWQDSEYELGLSWGGSPQRRIRADQIFPSVWNMIVHGADGVIFFCHDFSFSVPSGWTFDAGLLYEDGVADEVKRATDLIYEYEDVLLMQDLSGLDISSENVPVTGLMKNYNGDIYIFAMGDGNSTYIDGLSVDATIKIAGRENETVQVLGENRTIQMTNGEFSDHFDPYELHIYKF